MAVIAEGGRNIAPSDLVANRKPTTEQTSNWESAYTSVSTSGSSGVENPRQADLAARQAAGTDSPDRPAGNHAPLGRGNASGDVLDLQNKLTALGHDTGGADGIFGRKTEAAVRAFQAANGLDVDGIIGPQTRRALDHQQNPWETLDAGSLTPLLRIPATASGPSIENPRQADLAASTKGSAGVENPRQADLAAGSQSDDPEPKVVRYERYRVEGGGGGGPLEVDVGVSQEYLVERLDNGELLVTRTTGTSVAVEAGGRAGFSIAGGEHFEFDGLAVGEAGLGLTTGNGETFRLRSEDDLHDFFKADLARQAARQTTRHAPGLGIIGSFPGAGHVTDWAVGRIPGVPDLPPVEATIVGVAGSGYVEAANLLPPQLIEAGASGELAIGTSVRTDNVTGDVELTTYYDLSGAVDGAGPAVLEELGKAVGQDAPAEFDGEGRATLAFASHSDGSPNSATLTLEFRNGGDLQVHRIELDVNGDTPKAVLDVLQAGSNPADLPEAVAGLISNTTSPVTTERYAIDSREYGAAGGIGVADIALTYTVDSVERVDP